MTRQILRLYPLPAQELPAGGIYEDLELPPAQRRDPSRPYVVINMVSSVDGRTAIEGKSSRLGSETDRQTMRTLRSRAEAVMIGASTLRAEKLSLGLDEPSHQQPLAVIVTKSGDVPLGRNLVVGEHQEVLVITTQQAPEHLIDNLRRERARVLRAPATASGDVSLEDALKILKREHAVEFLLVEGGPTLNYDLVSANLADELLLTLAPKLLGGTTRDESLAILNGPAPLIQNVSLLSIHLSADELFLRYRLNPALR